MEEIDDVLYLPGRVRREGEKEVKVKISVVTSTREPATQKPMPVVSKSLNTYLFISHVFLILNVRTHTRRRKACQWLIVCFR